MLHRVDLVITSEETLGMAHVSIFVEAAVAIFETFLLAYAGITTVYSLVYFNFSTACSKQCMYVCIQREIPHKSITVSFSDSTSAGFRLSFGGRSELTEVSMIFVIHFLLGPLTEKVKNSLFPEDGENFMTSPRFSRLLFT